MPAPLAKIAPELPKQRCFAPVVDPNTRLLILGSLPGQKSLEMNQYYAQPQNGWGGWLAGVRVELSG